MATLIELYQGGPLRYLLHEMINSDMDLSAEIVFKRGLKRYQLAGAKKRGSRDYAQHSALDYPFKPVVEIPATK